MKKISKIFLVLMLALSLVACGGTNGEDEPNNGDEPVAGEKFSVAIVPKLTSVAWFERMEVGVNEWNEDNKDRDVDVFYTGSTDGDPAKQVQVLEDLIAQEVDAIAVVPLSTESLEPVLKKARDAGIVVIVHEGVGMENIDYGVEAFVNEEYGRHFMELIGEVVGGEGEYVQIVAQLTAASHNQWVDSAYELQQEKYPNMSRFGDKVESMEDIDTGYQKVKEVLTANNNIIAIQGSAMTDVPGAAKAVEEMGLQEQITIIGTSLVSVSGEYVRNGTIHTISFWDPALAGKAMIELSLAVLEGKEIKDGLNLNVPGYENLKLDGNQLYGAAWIDVNKDNVDDPAYDF